MRAQAATTPRTGGVPSGQGPPEPPQPRGSGLAGVATRGVAWNGASRLVTRGIQFGVTMVLARLLVPEEFGLVGMASVILLLSSLVTEMGFGAALVHKDDLTSDDVSTAFWTTMGLGVAMCLACVAAAPLAAAAFRTEEVGPVVVWSSLGLVVGAVCVTPQAVLRRNLEFRSMAVAEVASSIAYAVVAVVGALSGFGVWSLVAAGIALPAVRAVVLMRSSRIRPKAVFSRDSVRELVPFGSKVFGSVAVDYVRGNLDYFIVGSMLGPAALGLYTLAFKIADFPRVRLASSITEVAFPVVSAVQHDEDEVSRLYRKSLTGTGLITFPLLTGLAALAPEFVRVAYGTRWEGAIVPLQILLLMGLLMGPSEVGVTVLAAKGHAGVTLKLSVCLLIGVGLLGAAGVPWGISGVAVGVSIATALYFAASQVVLRRLVRVGLPQLASAVGVPLGGCAGIVLALQAYRSFTSGTGIIWLWGAVVLGAAAYAATVLALVGPRRARAVMSSLRGGTPDKDAGALVDAGEA